jgi:hypothetical protein
MKPKRNSDFDYVLLAALAIILFAAGCDRPPATVSSGDDQTRMETPVFEPETRHLTLPQGAKLTILLSHGVSSLESAMGDDVEGVVVEDLVADGRVVIPAGSTVTGAVTEARPLLVDGEASLAFTFNRVVTPDGNEVPIMASFARTRTGSGSGDTMIILGRIVATDDGRHDGYDDEGRVAEKATRMEPPVAHAANTPGMEVELPARTTVRLTMQAPVVVQVEGG